MQFVNYPTTAYDVQGLALSENSLWLLVVFMGFATGGKKKPKTFTLLQNFIIQISDTFRLKEIFISRAASL